MRLWSLPQTSLMAAAVWAIGLHSVFLGLALIVAPGALFGLVGWQPACDPFFWHQVGVFHIVLGAAYVWDYLAAGSVMILVGAKCAAVVFLSAECLSGSCETGQALAAAADAAMAAGVVALVAWLGRAARR